MAGPSESTKPTKAARSTLEALRREFQRCSNQYPALYHEVFKHYYDLPANGREIGELFSRTFPEKIGGGWQEWCRLGECHVERYFGSGEGLEEFRAIATSTYLAVFEIELNATTENRIGLIEFFDEADLPDSAGVGDEQDLWDWIEVLKDEGHHEWTGLLHELARQCLAPLLRSTGGSLSLKWEGTSDNGWTLRTEIAPPESSSYPSPRDIRRSRLVHSVFTSSVAAIDLILDILDMGTTELIDVESSDEPLPEKGKTVVYQSEGLHPPVLEFRFDGAAWRLKFDTGHGIEEKSFPEQEGFRELQELLSHPHRPMKPSELLGMVSIPIPGGVVKKKTEYGPEDQNRPVSQDISDDITIDKVEEAIASTKDKLKSPSLTAGERSDLDESLAALEKYRKQVVSQTEKVTEEGIKKGKRRKRKWDVGSAKALNLVGVRVSRARKEIFKKMPQFGEHLKKVKRCKGYFVYLK